jgi:hypothetical protein
VVTYIDHRGLEKLVRNNVLEPIEEGSFRDH